MSSIRTILAATDFSPEATRAAHRAAMLAAETGARMVMLHVIEPDGLVAFQDWLAKDTDVRDAIAQQAAMQLDALANQIQEVQGVSIERVVRHGRALDEVHEASIAADLVVVGARSDRGLREAALGTFADRLLRTAERPVLVVRRAATAAYGRALALTDFSAASQAAFGATLAVAPKAAVHLLHAFEVPFEGKLRLAGVRDEDITSYRDKALAGMLLQMRQAVAGVAASRHVQTEVAPADVRVAAGRAIGSLRPELVAVGKQGQSLLEDLLLGSTTNWTLAATDCDVLVVPARAALSPAGSGSAGAPA